MGGKSRGTSRSHLWWPLSGTYRGGLEGRALGAGAGGRSGRRGDVGRDGDVRQGRRGMDAGRRRGEGAAAGRWEAGRAAGLGPVTPPRRVALRLGWGT